MIAPEEAKERAAAEAKSTKTIRDFCYPVIIGYLAWWDLERIKMSIPISP